MERRFWEITHFSYSGKLGLSVAVAELCGSANSVEYDLKFETFACLEILPEQISWPSFEKDVEQEIIPGLLFKLRPGSYKTNEMEILDQQAGWVTARKMPCYVIHTETYDFYVASLSVPAVSLLSNG